MRVTIVGGTGLIGTRLTAGLASRGHTVTVVSRHERSVPGAVGHVTWDPATGGPPAEVMNADAIVNLAGTPVAGRWGAARKQAIRDSRVVTTARLVEAIAAAAIPPSVLVNGSAVGHYGDRRDEELTEASAPGTGFLAELCVEWESTAMLAADSGCRVVLSRTGIVLAKEGGALAPMARATKLGAGGPLGNGRQWWPWIHIDDVVEALAVAIEDGTTRGPINLTAPNPARQGDLAKALGRALHRPAIMPAPTFALRLALGEAAEFLLNSQRALPAALTANGYQFRHTDLAAALDAELGGSAN